MCMCAIGKVYGIPLSPIHTHRNNQIYEIKNKYSSICLSFSIIIRLNYEMIYYEWMVNVIMFPIE
jgi:hypothetical protein